MLLLMLLLRGLGGEATTVVGVCGSRGFGAWTCGFGAVGVDRVCSTRHRGHARSRGVTALRIRMGGGVCSHTGNLSAACCSSVDMPTNHLPPH